MSARVCVCVAGLANVNVLLRGKNIDSSSLVVTDFPQFEEKALNFSRSSYRHQQMKGFFLFLLSVNSTTTIVGQVNVKLLCKRRPFKSAAHLRDFVLFLDSK